MNPAFTDYLWEGYWIPLPKYLAFFAVLLLFYFFAARLEVCRRVAARVMAWPTWPLLSGLMVLGLALRLAWCSAAPVTFPAHYGEDKVEDESSLIQIYAVSTAEKGLPLEEDGRLQTRRPPGYPYLLAGLYKILGYHSWFYVAVQIIFGLALIPLSYLLGLLIFGDRRIGILAAFAQTIYPQNIYAVNMLLDEFPFFAATFGALCLAASDIRNRKIAHSTMIGILSGIATLFRTYTLFLPALTGVAYVFSGLPVRRAVLHTILGTAIVVALSGPWAWLTAQHYGKPCFSTTYGIIAFYGTLNDHAKWHNGYLPFKAEEGGDPAFYNETNPVKQAAVSRRLAAQWVLAHPWKTLTFIVQRNLFLYGFHLDNGNGITNVVETHVRDASSPAIRHLGLWRKMSAWAYALNAFLALAGIAILIFGPQPFWRSTPTLWLLVLFFGYWCLIHGLFMGARKYRWLMELFAFYPASFFLLRFGEWARISLPRRQQPPV